MITIQTTAEELFHDNGTISADADVSVTFDMWPDEPETRLSPGCPGGVEVVQWEIDHFTLYDHDGQPVCEGVCAPQWIRDAVADWVHDNDQALIEQACEEERDADEAAWEAKYERREY